ncbi:galactosylceramidase [Clonorchis sinensis]|uniref:Galactosylceramidase n=1 Tax=Clonorchis sinensis TaxID=79923 RepID=G7YVU4_CLOSI|nr:galactosylceramidase [Clonorchis sinensis]
MTANEPWSGHYTVNGPIWVTAHTTQFTKPGWYYLGHGTGVGHLPEGGSYVSLVSPDRNDLTIIVETMSHDHSLCIRPSLPHYTVVPQNVTFMLTGEKKSEYFNYLGGIEIVNNRFTLPLDIDELYTLSTIKAAENVYPKPPPSTPFVLPYVDNFQVRNSEKVREPEYLTPQVGYFELIPDPQQLATGITILQQMPLVQPIDWCNVGENPIAVMGYSNDW